MSNEKYKIELEFTVDEMADFLFYNFPANYRWKDQGLQKITVGNGEVSLDLVDEFTKCFKGTLLRQKFRTRS